MVVVPTPKSDNPSVDVVQRTRTVTHVTEPDVVVSVVTDGEVHDCALRARSSTTARRAASDIRDSDTSDAARAP